MRDIPSYPDDALHSTGQVADFIGRTTGGVREMVRRGLLTPKRSTRTSKYFETREIKRWLETATLFKDNKGVPPAHLKGHTDNAPEND